MGLGRSGGHRSGERMRFAAGMNVARLGELNCEGDPEAPNNRDLKDAHLGSGQPGRAHGPTAEEDEQEHAEHFG